MPATMQQRSKGDETDGKPSNEKSEMDSVYEKKKRSLSGLSVKRLLTLTVLLLSAVGAYLLYTNKLDSLKTVIMSRKSGVTPMVFPVRIDTLKIEILEEGEGIREVEGGDETVFEITARLAEDGRVFWSTDTTETKEFTTIVTPKKLIDGFAAGVLGMKQNESRRLFIPWDRGYGSLGNPPTIPAEADLIFDVKVLNIK